MQQSRVLVCDRLDEVSLAILREVAEVDVQIGLDDAALMAIVGEYHGIIVGAETALSADVIMEAVKLRVIGCMDDHLDRIDVTAAKDYGIEVKTATSADAVAIAEKTILLLLSMAQGTLAGKTLGLVGFGRIAQQVAQRAQAFNMNVIVNQPRLTPYLALDDIASVDLHDLLQQADFISLHLPNRPDRPALIGAEILAQLKPTASLINLAHPHLVDDKALLSALKANQLSAAATITFDDAPVQSHQMWQLVQLSAAITPPSEAIATLVRQVVDVLRIKRPSDTLSLAIVSSDLVMPHEAFDQKRVDKLKGSLDEAGALRNPPLVTEWAGKYVILDGATRFNALKQLDYPHISVQLVPPDGEFDLHTWYHAISHTDSINAILAELEQIAGLKLTRVESDTWQSAFEDPLTICYFIDRNNTRTLVQVEDEADKLRLMNVVVNCYTAWGDVERTLLTDIGRLIGQFPNMTAVAIFPQFKPTDVFNVARHGQLLPAGLTRFVIPGRVLHLDVPLEKLKSAEPLPIKRAWLNDYLADKLARSRIRYYQEPVILFGE